ncbi:MAG: hypothetical protein WC307_02735 [Candidatus Nanoarchaeia archaeon]|jgi:hypothetical protein
MISTTYAQKTEEFKPEASALGFIIPYNQLPLELEADYAPFEPIIKKPREQVAVSYKPSLFKPDTKTLERLIILYHSKHFGPINKPMKKQLINITNIIGSILSPEAEKFYL